MFKRLLKILAAGGIVAAIGAAIFGDRAEKAPPPFETPQHTLAINALLGQTLGYQGDRVRQFQMLLFQFNEPLQRAAEKNYAAIFRESFQDVPGVGKRYTEYGWRVLSFVAENADLRQEVREGLTSADPERIRTAEGLLKLLGHDVRIDGVVSAEEMNALEFYFENFEPSMELTRGITGNVSPHLVNLNKQLGIYAGGPATRIAPDVPVVDPVTYPTALAIVFDNKGRSFAGASNSARQANERATTACLDVNGRKKGTCFGIFVDTDEGKKTCAAITVHFLLNAKEGRGKPLEQQRSYTIGRGETAEEALDDLSRQCGRRVGGCTKPRQSHCNYKAD